LMQSLSALTDTKQGGDDEERCTELHGEQLVDSSFLLCCLFCDELFLFLCFPE
jgi:hypothetical protein